MTSPALVPSASQECGQLEAYLRVTSPCPCGATSHLWVFIEPKPWCEDLDVGTTGKAKRKSQCYLAPLEEWQTFPEKISRIRSLWRCLLGSPVLQAAPPPKPCPWDSYRDRQTACLFQELATECQEEKGRRQKPGLLLWVLHHHMQREKGQLGEASLSLTS